MLFKKRSLISNRKKFQTFYFSSNNYYDTHIASKTYFFAECHFELVMSTIIKQIICPSIFRIYSFNKKEISEYQKRYLMGTTLYMCSFFKYYKHFVKSSTESSLLDILSHGYVKRTLFEVLIIILMYSWFIYPIQFSRLYIWHKEYNKIKIDAS